MDVPNIVPTNADVNRTHLHETIRTLCDWGWHVFPLAPGKKTPITENGFKDATSDVTTALARFSHGRLNIGIATGPSDLVVADGDGEAGNVWLANAHDTYGIPPTFTVRTRAGGFHYYFKASEGIEIKCSASRIALGIDIRAEGGYVVGPTSWVDADKKGPAGWYRVIDDSPVAPLPEWLLHLLLASQARPTRAPLSVSDVEAAKLLGISRAGLHRFVRQGLIPKPLKLGRRSLYRVADLRACVDRLATP